MVSPAGVAIPMPLTASLFAGTFFLFHHDLIHSLFLSIQIHLSLYRGSLGVNYITPPIIYATKAMAKPITMVFVAFFSHYIAGLF